MVTTEQITEMILIVIPSEDRPKEFTPTYSRIGPNGTPDSNFEHSGGADQLLSFLQKELIPDVERRYRTNGERILVGYSLSGLFSLYALMRAPNAFQHTIVIDPSLWWDYEYLLSHASEVIGVSSVTMRKTVYICAGNTPSAEHNKMSENAQAFYNLLQSARNTYQAVYEYFDGETHSTIAVVGLYHGLRFFFEKQAEN